MEFAATTIQTDNGEVLQIALTDGAIASLFTVTGDGAIQVGKLMQAAGKKFNKEKGKSNGSVHSSSELHA